MGVPYAEVIGDPIEHSKSPAIHKFWLGKLGLEGDYRATRVTADELPAYLAARREDPDWRGCNVTMPLKAAVIPLLDEIRDDEIGAVNCISRYEGGLRGSNTDAAGVDDAIMSWDFASGSERVCIIGAGGGARAAMWSLNVYCYCYFDLIVRDQAKGRALLDSCEMGGDVYSFENASSAMKGRHGIINASPLGMAGFPPMPETVLGELADVGYRRVLGRGRYGFALDMVTAPVRTAFVERAQAERLITSDGLSMLIGQARSAFRSFFGVFPHGDDRELRERLTS
jgi:shikimate dehydrogenase